jgi:hypothetical protein
MVDWMFSSPPILLEAEVTPVISKFVLDAFGTSASRQRFSWPAAVHGRERQEVGDHAARA